MTSTNLRKLYSLDGRGFGWSRFIKLFLVSSGQGPRSSFLLVGLIEHRRCEISRGETFEIKSPKMPGNTSNFNNHDEVAYSFASILIFLMQTYVMNKSYWWGFSPASHLAPRSLLVGCNNTPA